MKISVVLTFVILLFTSCSYSSNEFYFLEIPYTGLPEIVLSTNFDTLENVLIRDSILFEYEVSIDTGKLYIARIYLGNYYIFSSDSIRNSLWINPTYLTNDGQYEMNMELLYKTTSGSLADRIDAEFAVLDTSWNIILNRGEILK